MQDTDTMLDFGLNKRQSVMPPAAVEGSESCTNHMGTRQIWKMCVYNDSVLLTC